MVVTSLDFFSSGWDASQVSYDEAEQMWRQFSQQSPQDGVIWRYGWKECSIGIPGMCLSPILGLQPSKTRPFPIKTGVIWVPGQCISHLKSLLQSMKRNTKKQQITAMSTTIDKNREIRINMFFHTKIEATHEKRWFKSDRFLYWRSPFTYLWKLGSQKNNFTIPKKWSRNPRIARGNTTHFLLLVF